MNEIIPLKDKIYSIRGKQVMLDRDLAELYGVETKRLNEQVKRNKDRFPERYTFQLNQNEKNELVANCDRLNMLKFSSVNPYVFTEQGVSMLSAVLKSTKAIQISIQIIDAFVNMRKYLFQNQSILQKFQQIDQKLLTYDQNFEEVFKAIESKQLTPKQGIFYDGELFDAFLFATSLVKQAKQEIILVDNYVDETTLTILSKKGIKVQVKIYTQKITSQLELAKNKFNAQYLHLDIFEFKKSHDRFLIIDTEVYHIGASLKDLGKKWFAFSKMSDSDILTKLL